MYHKYICPICGEVTLVPSAIQREPGDTDEYLEKLLTSTAYCEKCEPDNDFYDEFFKRGDFERL